MQRQFRQAVIAAAIIAAIFTIYGNAQNSRTNQIFRPCPSTTTPASVKIDVAGNISLNPCAGKSVTPTSGITAGSVFFAGTGGIISQDNAGFFYNDATNQLRLTASAITDTPLKITAFAGQTGDLAQVYDSLGTTKLFSIDKTGNIRIVSPAFGTFFGITDSNGARFTFDSDNAFFGIGNDIHFKWRSSTTLVSDIGLYRYAANVLAATDGSGSPTPGVRGLFGGGTAIASATAIPVPTGNIFHVTGTTSITSITSTNLQAGVCITLIFDGILTFTDGSNLKLAGNFVTTADDTISLCYDGTNWYETARAVN